MDGVSRAEPAPVGGSLATGTLQSERFTARFAAIVAVVRREKKQQHYVGISTRCCGAVHRRGW